jgi:hypothetical protein
MAYEMPVLNAGVWTAAADYSSNTSQYTVMKTTSATTVSKQTSNGGVAIGILQNQPASGSMAEVMLYGVSKARVNVADTIAVGDKVCASTGAGVIASTLVTKYVLGRALEGATGTTMVITVLLTHEGAGSSGAKGAA